MMNGNLEALARFEMKGVVERLGVQEHAQAVGLAHLCPLPHSPIVTPEDFVPVGHFVQAFVERQLRLDKTADAVIRAEIRVEIRMISVALAHPETGLK